MSEGPKQRSRLTFDKDAANYDLSWMYADVRRRYQAVVNEVVRHSFVTCLDIGCGTGALLAMVGRERPSARLSGVDISQQMIMVALHKLPSSTNLVVGDSERLPFSDQSFDLIVCTFSFHHYPNPLAALGEMRRVLAPKGTLIVTDIWGPTILRGVMNIIFRLGTKGDVRVYSQHEIIHLAQTAGLTVMKWSTIDWHAYQMVAARRS
jgi:ubiquinone/menaquinone biosynthesis C-methylase UbiE